MLIWTKELILGLANERPAVNDPRLAAYVGSAAMFVATDTGDVSTTDGQNWTKQGSVQGGTTYPGVTADGLTPAGLIIAGQLKASNVIIKRRAGINTLLLSLTDENDAPKVSFAVDGEIVTADDVLAPSGTIKGKVGGCYPQSVPGAPTTGAYNKGEVIVDSLGVAYICTVSGTPGTWQLLGAPAYTMAQVTDDYTALLTNDWIVMGAAGKVVTLPDASLVPANHPGFTVKVFGGSNCTVEPSQLAPPAAPVPTSPHTGGTVADGVYKVVVTYTNALGETLGSAQATVTAAGTVADTSTLVIPSPPPEGDASGWNAYVSAADGVTLYLQNVSPTPIGTDLTLTAPPSSITAQPPTSSTASVCAIDGVATYKGLASDKSAATFKSNGVDYLIGL